MVTRYCRASNQGKHMKIYLSGPISNDDPKLVAENIQAFLNARVSLLRLGHGVVSPIMNGVRVDAPWVDHMRADIIMMMGCDAVALLPGFAFSKGANIEADLAVQLGFLVRPLYWWLNSNLDSAK